MKIAVLTSSYPRFPGDGTAPFVMAFCEGLTKLSNDVIVAAPYDPLVRPTGSTKVKIKRFRYIWPDRLNLMGHARSLRAEVSLRPLSYLLLPFFLLGAFISLYRITGEQESNLIHVHWVLPNGLIAAWVAALRHIPFVVSLHGSDIYLARRNKIFGLLAKYIFHRASGVTACSPELLEAAAEMGAPQNSVLLAYGVDSEKFIPDQRNNEFRQMLGIGKDDLLIVTLGRLVYKKGFNVLIDSTAEIVKSGTNIHVVIGGEGPLKSELNDQVKTLNLRDCIQFIGPISWDQVPEFLASGDIFVLPSIRDQYGNIDGLPNVLLEAMSSGTAVVASDIPGVKSVLDDSQSGILVSSGDPRSLSQKIKILVENPTLRHTLGKAGRTLIQEHFTWDAIVKKLEKLFESVIDKT